MQPGLPSRGKLCALPQISRHLVGLLTILLALTAGLFLAVAPRTAKVKDAKFARARGLYDGPVTETITSATPGATIVYTTDGTEPSPSNGTAVSPAGASASAVATVEITRTTALRAAAFKDGYAPTNLDTHTYIMLPGVLAQDGTGLPPHAIWGHNGPDWAMDPRIVGSPRFGPTIAAALRSLPSLALTMDWDDLFGRDNRGIYIDGEDVRKAAVAELIVPPGVPGEPFHALATVEVVGAIFAGQASRTAGRHNLTSAFSMTMESRRDATPITLTRMLAA